MVRKPDRQTVRERPMLVNQPTWRNISRKRRVRLEKLALSKFHESFLEATLMLCCPSVSRWNPNRTQTFLKPCINIHHTPLWKYKRSPIRVFILNFRNPSRRQLNPKLTLCPKIKMQTLPVKMVIFSIFYFFFSSGFSL